MPASMASSGEHFNDFSADSQIFSVQQMNGGRGVKRCASGNTEPGYLLAARLITYLLASYNACTRGAAARRASIRPDDEGWVLINAGGAPCDALDIFCHKLTAACGL